MNFKANFEESLNESRFVEPSEADRKTVVLWGLFTGLLIFIILLIENIRYSSDARLLQMDERIIFEGVWGLLHPSDFKSWLHLLGNGDDLRYGRGYWNVGALFALVPTYFFGEQGAIVSVRLLYQTALFAAYLNFARVLFSISRMRMLACFLVLVLLPSTSYLATAPKPEPLIMLLVSIVFARIARSMRLDVLSFVLLGFVWGLKISTAPLLFVVAVMFLWQLKKEQFELNTALKTISNSFLGFLIGWVVCTPFCFTFLWPLIASSVFISVVSKRNLFRINRHKSAIVYATFLPSFAALGAIFLAPSLSTNLDRWLNFTIRNTAHGSDSPSVNASSWLNYLKDQFLVIDFQLQLAGIFCLVVIAIGFIRRKIALTDLASLLLTTLIAGFTLIVPIVYKVQRLWPYYLHVGLTLVLVSVIGMFKVSPAKDTKRSSRALPIAGWLIIGVFVWSQGVSTANATKSRWETTKIQFQSLLLTDSEIREEIDEQVLVQGDALRIALDPIYLSLPPDARYSYTNFWGPFVGWNDGFDLVVLSEFHLPLDLREDPTKGIFRNEQPPNAIANNENLKDHIDLGLGCNSAPCFSITKRLSAGGIILEPSG